MPSVPTRSHPEPRDIPVDALPVGRANAIEYILWVIEEGGAPADTADPNLCLLAQRIVDTAAASAAQKRTLELLP